MRCLDSAYSCVSMPYRLCGGVFLLLLVAFVISLPGAVLAQEQGPPPQQEPGEAGPKDGPVVVPQSPEEKKALRDALKNGEKAEEFDKVVLKDLTVIRGRVVDPGGPTIRVEQKLGAVTILKSQIKELRLHGGLDSGPIDDDIIHLKDGQTIRGKSKPSEDGKSLIIEVVKDGKINKVTLPYNEVQKIEHAAERKKMAQEKLAKFTDPLAGRIDKLLTELASEEEAVWRAAREKLVGLGIFAQERLREKSAAAKNLEGRAAGRVEEIITINEIKNYVSPEAIESLRSGGKENVYDRLVSSDKEKKLAILRELVLLEGVNAASLLKYFAKRTGEASSIRSFCIHALAKAECNHILVELMREQDGWLRLVAALHLVDNGIFLGVPYFISALDMRDPGVRQAAVEKLRLVSGEKFGFDPQGTQQQRQAAVKKWEEWWNKHESEILRQSAKALSSAQITDEDKTFSKVYQKRAHEMWDKGEVSEASNSFRKALELDPSNLAARLSLAVLLYTEQGNQPQARAELKLILRRYSDEASATVRKYALYHMALVDLSEGKWEGAIHNLNSAISIDDKFVDAYVALGNAYYIQAVRDETISRERLLFLPEPERKEQEARRRQVVERSVRGLAIGLSLLDEEIRYQASTAYRQKRRRAEREILERAGAKARGLKQAEWEASYRERMLRKKARVCVMLADSYAMQLEFRKAVPVLGDAVTLQPKNLDYLCKFASALAAAGNIDAARKTFKRALAIDPKNEKAAQGLKDLR